MTKLPSYLAIIGLALLYACGSGSSSKTSEKPAETKAPALSIDAAGASIKWTAYKFTERVGVGGTFDSFTITPKNSSGSVEDILQGGQIAITTESVNSGNEIRDPKLRASFFAPFNTPEISGVINSAADGKGELSLTMNEMTFSNDFTYAANDTALIVKAEIDVSTWGGEDAITELNKVCSDLHIGADGTSKLWPDVSVVLSVPLKK